MTDEDLFNDGLFPEPDLDFIRVGEQVTLGTLWGEEPCRVEELGHDKDGWPVAVVTVLKTGDRTTVNRGRLREGP